MKKGIVKELSSAQNKVNSLSKILDRQLEDVFDHKLYTQVLDVSGFVEVVLYPAGTDIGFYRKLTPERLEIVWSFGADRLQVITDVIREFHRTGPIEGTIIG